MEWNSKRNIELKKKKKKNSFFFFFTFQSTFEWNLLFSNIMLRKLEECRQVQYDRTLPKTTWVSQKFSSILVLWVVYIMWLVSSHYGK